MRLCYAPSLLYAVILMFLFTVRAEAFGSRNPEPKEEDRAIQAIPYRQVELAHITVPNFHLPNGNRGYRPSFRPMRVLGLQKLEIF